MNKLYHYIVTYNSDTRVFEIDWSQTNDIYDTGNRYNNTTDEWERPEELDEKYIVQELNNKIKKYGDLHKKEFKMARTDKLTGLANRHYFDQKLGEEVQYADISGSPLNILMFDLDNFKRFNDSYGHVWGDKLLTLFSDIIMQNIRKCDIIICDNISIRHNAS